MAIELDEDEYVEWCLSKRLLENKKEWYLSKIIGKGLNGHVYMLCDDKNKTKCTHVIKVTESIDKEVRNQKKCSDKLSFVAPIDNAWMCSNAGLIITRYFPISFEDFLLSKKNIGIKMCVIYKIILNIHKMHTMCNVFHLDLHLENIMLDDKDNPYFIDFGSSVDIDILEDIKEYDRMYYGLMSSSGILKNGYDYIKISSHDYKKFIYKLDLFIKEHSLSFDRPEYSILEKFMVITNNLSEYYGRGLVIFSNKNKTVDDARKFENDIIEYYTKKIKQLF